MKNLFYTKTKLANGITLIIQPIPYFQSVSVYIAVAAGPRYETKETAGLAHFLEHMLFEGTEKFPSSKDVAQYIEKVGGKSGAWTDKEYVIYYAKVPKEHVDVAVNYLSEILFKSTLKEDAIEKEKNIVLEELKRKTDNPEIEAWDLWSEWTWGKNQSLGRSTLGSEASIKSITRNKLKTYMARFYVPSNMVIAVCGNASVGQVKRSVFKYFKNIKNKKATKPSTLRFLHKKQPVKIIQKNLAQNQLILGFFTGVSLLHKDRFPMQVLVDVLSRGVSSRLFHKLVYELGLAYSAYAGGWFFSDTGLFYIYCGVSSENVERALKEILLQINLLKNTKVSEKELSESKIKAKADMLFLQESPDALASLYATQELLEKRVTTLEEFVYEIDAVTAEEIQNVANRYFTLSSFSFLINGPFNKGEKTVEKLVKDMIV